MIQPMSHQVGTRDRRHGKVRSGTVHPLGSPEERENVRSIPIAPPSGRVEWSVKSEKGKKGEKGAPRGGGAGGGENEREAQIECVLRAPACVPACVPASNPSF